MEVMERGGGVCDQAFQMYSVQRYIAMKGEWVQIQEKTLNNT